MKKIISLTLLSSVVLLANQGPELYPPNAEVGKCYARVFIPAQYKIEEERVLKSDGKTKSSIIPAKYRMVTKKIKVSPESYKLKKIPAKYKTINEKVLIKSSSTTWKKGKSHSVEQMKGTTGEIMCLVETKPEYKIIEKRVLVEPATTKKVRIPAKYKTIKLKEEVEPATTQKIRIPARYKIVKLTEEVSPERMEQTQSEPTYQTIKKRVKVKDSALSWKEVKCKSSDIVY